MEIATWEFLTGLYEDISEDIKQATSNLIRGLLFTLLWVVILAISIGFVGLSFIKPIISIGILLFLVIIELLILVGKRVK